VACVGGNLRHPDGDVGDNAQAVPMPDHGQANLLEESQVYMRDDFATKRSLAAVQ